MAVPLALLPAHRAAAPGALGAASPSATPATRPITGPRLSISVSDGQTIAKAGGQLTYSVHVRNIGTSAAPNLVITLTLPPGVPLVSASAHGSSAKEKITWRAGVPAGGSQTFWAAGRVTHRRPGRYGWPPWPARRLQTRAIRSSARLTWTGPRLTPRRRAPKSGRPPGRPSARRAPLPQPAAWPWPRRSPLWSSSAAGPGCARGCGTQASASALTGLAPPGGYEDDVALVLYRHRSSGDVPRDGGPGREQCDPSGGPPRRAPPQAGATAPITSRAGPGPAFLAIRVASSRGLHRRRSAGWALAGLGPGLGALTRGARRIRKLRLVGELGRHPAEHRAQCSPPGGRVVRGVGDQDQRNVRLVQLHLLPEISLRPARPAHLAGPAARKNCGISVPAGSWVM